MGLAATCSGGLPGVRRGHDRGRVGKKEPHPEVVKRTSLPMIAGVVFMFVLSMIVFLPMGA